LLEEEFKTSVTARIINATITNTNKNIATIDHYSSPLSIRHPFHPVFSCITSPNMGKTKALFRAYPAF